MAAPSTSRRFDPAKVPRLAPWLAAAVGATRLDIVSASRLAGGAVQDNWRLDVEVADGPRAGAAAWVLRTDAAARVSLSLDRGTEAEIVGLAHRRGIPVPEPIARCTDTAIAGAPFFVQRWMPGNAHARLITRDPALDAHGKALARELGRTLAGIHAITPGSLAPGTAPHGIPSFSEHPAKAEVARLRAALVGAGEPRPALEYVLAWLDRCAPVSAPAGICLVHGDYRTGNYLVDAGRMTAILDWEFAHWGDPHEDIGWFAARCWRFGNDDKIAGGIAPLEPFLAGYDEVAPGRVDRRCIGYWQIMAAAKWAVIAVLQGDRFRLHGEQRLELALTGLMPAEMEFDALSDIIALMRQPLPWAPDTPPPT